MNVLCKARQYLEQSSKIPLCPAGLYGIGMQNSIDSQKDMGDKRLT